MHPGESNDCVDPKGEIGKVAPRATVEHLSLLSQRLQTSLRGAKYRERDSGEAALQPREAYDSKGGRRLTGTRNDGKP